MSTSLTRAVYKVNKDVWVRRGLVVQKIETVSQAYSYYSVEANEIKRTYNELVLHKSLIGASWIDTTSITAAILHRRDALLSISRAFIHATNHICTRFDEPGADLIQQVQLGITFAVPAIQIPQPGATTTAESEAAFIIAQEQFKTYAFAIFKRRHEESSDTEVRFKTWLKKSISGRLEVARSEAADTENGTALGEEEEKEEVNIDRHDAVVVSVRKRIREAEDDGAGGNIHIEDDCPPLAKKSRLATPPPAEGSYSLVLEGPPIDSSNVLKKLKSMFLAFQGSVIIKDGGYWVTWAASKENHNKVKGAFNHFKKTRVFILDELRTALQIKMVGVPEEV
ncbi:hypothetical protein B0O99DRAFT_687747 [Bisporella sp. PMI_857]|nr:hypothetical protein B0O99DRAFT_687747 [Bisporella sp. PMI_857]